MSLQETVAEKEFKITFADKYETKNKYAYFASISKDRASEQTTSHLFNTMNNETEFKERYQILLDNLRKKKFFNRTTDVVWICKNCGYVHIGAEAPLTCPICNNPQSYFEIQDTNY